MTVLRRIGAGSVLVALLAGCGSSGTVSSGTGSSGTGSSGTGSSGTVSNDGVSNGGVETPGAPAAPAKGSGRRQFSAELSGDEEVPGPGVQDGSGTAHLTLEGDRLCYELRATFGEQPTAAHIHDGEQGTRGPVVSDLRSRFAPGEAAFEARSCLPVGRPLLDGIGADPGRYYVDVHTEEHPDGAVRGQLRKGSA